MSRFPGRIGRAASGLGLWLLGGLASGQQVEKPAGFPLPRIATVFPIGGRSGTVVEVVVTGTDLDTPESLLFSQPGIGAESIGLVEVPADAKANRNGRRGMGASLAGPLTSWKFKVTIPGDVPAGSYDLRLVNRWGASNPRAFVVGGWPETAEQEPNDDTAQAQRIAVNTTVDAIISQPTDIDDYLFDARAGQRVLASGLASSIDSRLLLALELYDASGKRLATNHEYRGTDALLDFVAPSDGTYLLRAFAFTYTQGGPDHYYRLTLTTAPWIDAVFPSSIAPGTSARVTVFGRNLPGGTTDPRAVENGIVLETLETTIQAPDDPQMLGFHGFLPPGSSGLDGFEFRVKGAAGVSNPFLMTMARAPVVLDRGENETPEHAQEVSIPCELAGRIEAPRDRDWYAFRARKGETLVIEALGERLRSPIDLYFALRDAQTRQTLAENDDGPEPRNNQGFEQLFRNQFYTRTQDPPRHRFVAPADGRYELLVTSREAASRAGPRHLYVVRIVPEQPDFRLVVMPPAANYPDSLVIRRGGETEAWVYVWREDGFKEEIELRAEGLPEGVTCPPQVIGSGEKHGILVFSASADAPANWTGAIRVKGMASIAGQTVVREARSATISWPVPQQQNIPTISRLDQSLVLAVRDQAPFRIAADAEGRSVVHGDKVEIALTIKTLGGDLKGKVQNFALTNVPQVLAGSVTFPVVKDATKAVIDVKPTVPPGVYSLVFRAQGQVGVELDPKTKTKTDVTVIQPSPPVMLTVIPKELAKVTIAPGNPQAKPGQSAEVTVRVSRLFDYAGEFTVMLDIPADANGLSAEPITIPSGQNEARLKVAIDADAATGNRANLVARVTGLYREKTPVQHEVKFNLNVVK